MDSDYFGGSDGSGDSDAFGGSGFEGVDFDGEDSRLVYDTGTGHLWERLFGGGCTRVVLLGGGCSTHFPQALGLLPMIWHRYRIEGSVAVAAAKLAATDRWIVEGEPWVQYFMPRAQVIISVELPYTARAAKTRRSHKPARHSGDSILDVALDQSSAPIWSRGVPKSPILALAEDEYPGKLLRVTSWAQIRALRKVHADESDPT